MNGYWKFHRAMYEHPIWKRPMATRLVWITILGFANFTDKEWLYQGTRIKVPTGTWITTQEHLADLAGVSRKQVRCAIKDLIALDSIRANQRANRYTEICVVNWPIYQSSELHEGQPKGQERANRGPTEGQDVIRKEGKKNTLGQNHNGFDRWWEAYPKKVGKQQAILQWDRLNPDESLAAIILEAILKQRGIVRAMIEGDRAHILDPERWLKYRRWEDDLTVNTQQQSMYPTL